jgi:hypothetical protein
MKNYLKQGSGYTTTLKLMQIMNEKGLVKRDDSVKNTYLSNLQVSKEKTAEALCWEK